MPPVTCPPKKAVVAGDWVCTAEKAALPVHEPTLLTGSKNCPGPVPVSVWNEGSDEV